MREPGHWDDVAHEVERQLSVNDVLIAFAVATTRPCTRPVLH
jgi:hypothetical protein